MLNLNKLSAILLAAVVVTVPSVACPASANTVYGTSGSTTLECVLNGPYVEFDVTMTPNIGQVTAFAGTVTVNTLIPTVFPFSGVNYGPLSQGRDSIQVTLADFESGSYIATAAGGGTTTKGEFYIGGVPTGLPFCTFAVP